MSTIAHRKSTNKSVAVWHPSRDPQYRAQTVAILRSTGSQVVLAKRIGATPPSDPHEVLQLADGSEVFLMTQARARTFSYRGELVNDLDGLDQLIRRQLGEPREAVIQGRARDGIDPARMRRLLRADHKTGETATLEDVASSIFWSDHDRVRDIPGVDFRAKPEVYAEAARKQLPERFHTAACVWAATGSAGFKPGARLRLACILDRPMSCAEKKAWVAECEVDQSLYDPAHLIFTAAPILDGVADPMPKRVGRLDGTDRVAVPTQLPKPAVSRRLNGQDHDAFLDGGVPNYITIDFDPTQVNTYTNGVDLGWWDKFSPETKDIELGRMLECLPADEFFGPGSYDKWTRVLWAASRSGAPHAREIAEAVSKTKGGPAYDEGAFERVWNEGAARDASSGQPVAGIGSLIHDAKQAGYRPPQEETAQRHRFEPPLLTEKELRAIPGAYEQRDRKGNRFKPPRITIGHITPMAVEHILTEHYDIELHYNIITKMIDHGAATEGLPPFDLVCAMLGQLLGKNHLPNKNTKETVALTAVGRHYNPVVEYLERLEWDGRGRLADVVACVTTSSPPRATRVLFMLLVGACAAADHAERVKGQLARGVDEQALIRAQFDTVPVLVGTTQGGSRTSLMRALVPPTLRPYVADGMSLAPRNKDSVMAATSFWIVELGEIDGILAKHKAEDIKAFLSRLHDPVRRPYAKDTERLPRRTLFWGTTNREQFLVDETGNRRFPMAPVDRVDLAALAKIDLDQLWAEAWHLYCAGTPWWPVAGELTAWRKVQAEARQPLRFETEILDSFDWDQLPEVLPVNWDRDPAVAKDAGLTARTATEVFDMLGSMGHASGAAAQVGKALRQIFVDRGIGGVPGYPDRTRSRKLFPLPPRHA